MGPGRAAPLRLYIAPGWSGWYIRTRPVSAKRMTHFKVQSSRFKVNIKLRANEYFSGIVGAQFIAPFRD